MPRQQAVSGSRTGGRSARVREAVLAATLDELIEQGSAALGVEAIATRAGVNKTTVYRRWPTLDDLLVDALTTWSQDALPAPDTGSIRGDLVALGRQLAQVLNDGVGRQIAGLVLTTGLRSADLRATTRRYFDHQVTRAEPTVERAIGRGELPAGTDVTAVLSTFRAPLFHRLVTTGEPIDEELIVRSVDITLAAAQAGLLADGAFQVLRPLPSCAVSGVAGQRSAAVGLSDRTRR